MSKVMIIGGHGKVAQLATPLLVQAGHTVTSIIRNPGQEDTIRTLGAIPMVFDIEQADREEFAEAFRGQDAIIWAAGAGGGNPDRTYAVDRDAAIASIDAAQQVGANRYIMVSYLGSSLDHDIPNDSPFYPYAQSKAIADDHLMQSELDWTILGPGTLTLDDPSDSIRRVGRMASDTLAEGENRDTSRANVAHAILSALTSDKSIRTVVDFVDEDTPINHVFGL
ncbi:NAD(P)-dependent oxidoreductase [Enteractinococcus helveticum]|uniref:NAD-dependent dehydratase n=1 Tax=Enteractinococcus helveticum TaxID=1837282 RepID=A0A1B7M0C4_9MICC|nr:NAD(P)H-binding protein [Enteractinococcus helveticum]OAV61551.1 NAD-dependent dehydratase [Enteractinococcus helveticum]